MEQSTQPIHPEPAIRVLIIDDEPAITSVITELAESLGCIVSSSNDGQLIDEYVKTFDPDIIFLDLIMPKANGIEVIHILGLSQCRANLVLMTALEEQTLLSARQVAENYGLNVIAAVSKPFKLALITNILQPLADKMETGVDTSSSTAPTQSDLGPVLLFEQIQWLDDSDIDGKTCLRVHNKWITDDEAQHNIEAMLDQSLAAKTEFGLIALSFKLLKLELLGLSHAFKRKLLLALPIDPVALLDDQLADILNRGAKTAGLGTDNICVEIRHDEAIQNRSVFKENLSKLKAMGFKISQCVGDNLDAAFMSINRLPIDEIIVDVSSPALQSRSLASSETQFDLGSLVSYGAKHNTPVSARNIHSKTQLEFAYTCQFSRISGQAVQQSVTSLTEI